MNSLIKEHILGLTDTGLLTVPELECRLHPEVVSPLLTLAMRAGREGFLLKVASSFRGFERQLLIWNAKARGERDVLNDHGVPIDVHCLTPREKVFAILRWSALPGASRHHWGTDIDVYDGSRIAADYRLQLTVAETENGGPFAEFHQWLNLELQNSAQGFYRPYAFDCAGVAPEPWHLSYAPVARQFEQALSEGLLSEQLASTDIELKSTILDNLPEIFSRFIKVDEKNNKKEILF